MLPWGSEIPCPGQTASGRGRRHWIPLPSRPPHPRPHSTRFPRRRAPAGAGCQPEGIWDQLRRHRGRLVPVGTRGRGGAARSRCSAAAVPAATRPRPTWGRFKSRRRISWPRARRPAGCLGGARRGICWASQGARFPPSAGGGWRGLPRTPRPSAPTPPTSKQQPKPTPQAGPPALPAKGVGLASCPLLIPGIPKDDHRFPPEKALEPAKASRDELIRR